MLKKTIYAIHRILGTAISLVFLMWFITGLVLIYHSFPDVNKETRNLHRDIITDSLPPITDLLNQIPAEEQFKTLQLNQYKNQSLFTLTTNKQLSLTNASLVPDKGPISQGELKAIASKWVDAPILKIDTLQKRDVWIMYTRYLKELPIYKIHFDDKEKHQLYISSITGEVQQFTTQSERFWAYIGSIPHKFYIPALRQHTTIWINTLNILSAIAFIVVLSGFILAFRALWKRYRIQRNLSCPYKKPIYKWHYLLGLIFGIFLLTWSISGILALKKVPQWMVKTHTNYHIPQKIKGKKIHPSQYKLDYRVLQKEFSELKQIEWEYFQGVPIYHIINGSQELYIDASADTLKILNLSEQNIRQAIEHIHGADSKYTIELIHEYENYYLPWKRHLDLPVYKVTVDTEDNNLYYISPETGSYKYLDNNKKARKFLFNTLHYLHNPWLMDKPEVWTILIWILVLGCITTLSTGVWLSCTYVVRKFKKKPKKSC